MLPITIDAGLTRQGRSRRELMCAGSLGALGIGLSDLLLAEEVRKVAPKAKSCILFFLEGGPAHQDTWDVKPEAPAEVRGEFEPIATSVPGTLVCEHLPLLSKQMHHLAQIRSVHHTIVDHNAGAYFAFTGRPPVRGSRLIVHDEPTNFPPIGSVFAREFPTTKAVPPFVQLPAYMSNNGFDLPGQRSGFLGAGWNPFIGGDPSLPRYRVPGLSLPNDLSMDRVRDRRSLLRELDASLESRSPFARMDQHFSKAFDLISTPAAKRAFDIEAEPLKVRERYGVSGDENRKKQARQFGGLPHLGQCMLMARRLIEAGVRVVTVCTGRRFCQAWDTHRDHFPLLKKSLLPYVDRAFSALLEDLDQRGLLEETLVVAMGEFGRTPKLGQVTSSAGADRGGRDHWPHCYTTLLAGAGIKGGMIFGSSDAFAAYPNENPVTPQDVAATIYEALGINPEKRIKDPLGIPHTLAEGKPIKQVLA